MEGSLVGREGLPTSTDLMPAYEVWRERIRSRFA